MKNTHKILVTLCIFFCIGQLRAVTPQAIPYQGVARDGSGNILANQNISLRFLIHTGSAIGAVAYGESQNTMTNSLGLFNLNIGTGFNTIGNMSSIDWGNGDKYLEVLMDPTGGAAYISMGTTQMMSVPYALYADKTSTKTYFNSGFGSNPQTSLAFLTEPLLIEITSPTQRVLVTSSKALGCLSSPGTGLRLWIGYNTSPPTAISLIGDGSFDYTCPANNRLSYSLSAEITGLSPGSYYVGLAGSTGSPANWNSNEYGYTTAIVFN